MRTSILREIEALKGLTHAFVLTHNVDLLFLQGLVLRALRAAGEPTLTVFADAGCAAESFAAQAPLAVGLGQRYRLVPVDLASRGRFHPKAILLASRDEATLFVGSGNLTFGGWCDNGEVWVRFRTSEGEGAAVAAFKAYLDEVISGLPLASALAAELNAAFDPTSRTWANPLPRPGHLVGRVGEGPSLLTRLGERLRGQYLTVCSPYFDMTGEALRLLARFCGAVQTTVLTQEATTNLLPDALASWPAAVHTFPADYFHVNEKGERRRARLHAKWMIVTRADGSCTAIVGSANCSRAALAATGSRGNAELVVVVHGEAEELASQLRAEIEVYDRPIVLMERLPDPEEDEVPRLTEPSVLAARLDGGTLRVAVGEGEGFVPQTIEADGVALSTEFAGLRELVGYPDAVPKRVRVTGLRNGKPWSTSECWVDIEAMLRGSAGRRRLLDLIRQSQDAGLFNIEVWADLVNAAFEEISSPTPHGGNSWRPTTEEGASRTWHEADVFLPNFDLPGTDRDGHTAEDDDVVSSTLDLLFNWSQGEEGVDRLEVLDEDQTHDVAGSGVLVESEEGAEGAEGAEGKMTTSLTSLSAQVGLSPERASKYQAKALAVLEKMLDMLADPAFLGTRSPGDIRRAIIMLALLLRTGRYYDWLSGNHFFAVTHRAWRAVFFSGVTLETQGELAARLEREEDPEGFREALATPRLAAALAAWALAARRQATGRDLARFDLTCAVSAAHHPWMWRGGSLERISQELHRLVRSTYQADEELLLATWWPKVQRRGAAISALERAINGANPVELRSHLGAWSVQPGALLWQGRAGWCVSEEAATSSAPAQKIAVRKLQGDESRCAFQAGFLIPVRELVESMSGCLSHQIRTELNEIIFEAALLYTDARGP